ncbi:MAG TPA: hypothetical protein VH497_17445 [Vicinamibacterales bacterium]
MLWYKSWLDTRWRFLIGFFVLLVMACGTFFDYLATMKLIPLARSVEVSGELGRRVKEAIELERNFRGFVWVQWFRQNLSHVGTLFAILLGSGGLLSRTTGAALFTLSLPVTRRELLEKRAATGLIELLALAIVPSLIIPIAAPAIGQSYSLGDALVHGVCMFVAAAVFFSVAFLLSSAFDDLWRPLLITCAVAFVLATIELVAGDLGRFGIFHVMSAESYFRSGSIPWIGLFVSAAMTAGLLYSATVTIAKRDF